jgi:hypothetical protein
MSVHSSFCIATRCRTPQANEQPTQTPPAEARGGVARRLRTGVLFGRRRTNLSAMQFGLHQLLRFSDQLA